MKAFNVNDTIWVKLTPLGQKIHWRKHLEFWGRLGKLSEFPYTPPRTNAQGFSSFQLWSFMQEFGPEFQLGALPFIEGNDIYFEEPK
jgi:hypothetical protein